MGSKSSPAPQPTNTTQVSSTAPPDFLKPFITDQFLPKVQELSQQPNPFIFEGNKLAGFTPQQLQALGITEQQALNPTAANQAASGGLTSFLQDPSGGLGAGLGAQAANPLSNLPQSFVDNLFKPLGLPIEEQIAASSGNIVDQFNQNVAPQTAFGFGKSGAFGGSAHQETDASNRFNLARALGQNELGIRTSAANQELDLRKFGVNAGLAAGGAQAQASNSLIQNLFSGAGLAPSVSGAAQPNAQALYGAGAQQQQFQQQQINQEIADFMQQAGYPLQALDILGSGITTAGGGYASTSSAGSGQYFAPQQGGLDNILGLGALAGLFV